MRTVVRVATMLAALAVGGSTAAGAVPIRTAPGAAQLTVALPATGACYLVEQAQPSRDSGTHSLVRRLLSVVAQEQAATWRSLRQLYESSFVATAGGPLDLTLTVALRPSGLGEGSEVLAQVDVAIDADGTTVHAPREPSDFTQPPTQCATVVLAPPAD